MGVDGLSQLLEYACQNTAGFDEQTRESIALASELSEELDEVAEQIRSKRAQLNQIRSELEDLERTKDTLQENLSQERGWLQSTLLSMFVTDGAGCEKKRRDAEVNVHENELRLVRLWTNLDTTVKFRSSQVLSAEGANHTRQQLAAKAAGDEKVLLLQAENEKILRQEVTHLVARRQASGASIQLLSESNSELNRQLSSLRDSLSLVLQPLNVNTIDSCPVMGIELAEGSVHGVAGVLVVAVRIGGAAESGGLCEGDLITTLNNRPVRSKDEFRTILHACCLAGQTVPVDFYRKLPQAPTQSQKYTVRVVLAAASEFPDTHRKIKRSTTKETLAAPKDPTVPRITIAL